MDVRVVERNVDRGIVRSEDVEKAAKGLPDDSENAEYVNIETLASDDQGVTNGHAPTQH